MEKTVGDKIKERREKAGWSQTKLAQKADVQPSTISQIESGDRKTPSTKVLEKIANAFKTSVSKLLGQASNDELADLLQDPEVQGLYRNFKTLSPPDRDLILKQIKFLKSQGD